MTHADTYTMEVRQAEGEEGAEVRGSSVLEGGGEGGAASVDC